MSALSLPYHSAILGVSKRRPPKSLLVLSPQAQERWRPPHGACQSRPFLTEWCVARTNPRAFKGTKSLLARCRGPPRLPLAVQMWFQLAKPARVPLLLARSVVGLLAGHLRPDNEGKTLLSLEVCFSSYEPDMNENSSLFLYSVLRAFIPFILGWLLLIETFTNSRRFTVARAVLGAKVHWSIFLFLFFKRPWKFLSFVKLWHLFLFVLSLPHPLSSRPPLYYSPLWDHPLAYCCSATPALHGRVSLPLPTLMDSETTLLFPQECQTAAQTHGQTPFNHLFKGRNVEFSILSPKWEGESEEGEGETPR